VSVFVSVSLFCVCCVCCVCVVCWVCVLCVVEAVQSTNAASSFLEAWFRAAAAALEASRLADARAEQGVRIANRALVR
jgi:hypothetical protein